MRCWGYHGLLQLLPSHAMGFGAAIGVRQLVAVVAKEEGRRWEHKGACWCTSGVLQLAFGPLDISALAVFRAVLTEEMQRPGSKTAGSALRGRAKGEASHLAGSQLQCSA